MSQHDDLAAAIASHRDRQFAELIVLVVGLAAEKHPDLLRHALASVFDLSVVEARSAEAQRLARLAFREASRLAAATRDLVNEVHRDLEQLERRQDALDHRTTNSGTA